MISFRARLINAVALNFLHKEEQSPAIRPIEPPQVTSRAFHAESPAPAVLVQTGRARARTRRRQGDPGGGAPARLVGSLVSAQDRVQDHAARGRRGARSRPPSDPRRARPRRLPAGRERGRHAGADRARHHHRAQGLGSLRRSWHVAEARGQCSGLGIGQPPDRHHRARGAAEGGELAGSHPRSHGGRDHPRSQARERYRRRVAGGPLHAGARRFRRRLFLARTGAPAALQRAQDRPRLRDQLPLRSRERGALRSVRRARQAVPPQDESHKLQAIGCEVGQGYLFAKPMPRGQLIGLLRKRLVGTPGAGAQPKPRASWLIPGLSTKG